jgi:phosphatidylserine decarboxylase
MSHEGGSKGSEICLVSVGATVVGKVRVAFDFLTTNLGGRKVVKRSYAGRERRFAKGEEWGRFEIGSTIVLVAAPGVVELDVQAPGSLLRLGRRIGRAVAAQA